MSGIGFLDSFNARNLAPEQVAETFVAPDSFYKLMYNCHTIVLGPRGSGKTTLLKMLDHAGLDSWNAEAAVQVRQSVRYNRVFVATDIHWGRQVASLKHYSPDQPSNVFAEAAFTTHIIKRFVETVSYLAVTKYSDKFDKNIEAEVCKMLSDVYFLPRQSNSLLSLRQQIGNRLTTIYSYVRRLEESARRGEQLAFPADEYLYLPPITLLSNSLDVINAAVEAPSLQWAFMFDELELAPDSIKKLLLECLRSTDQRILFKLALVPATDEHEQIARICMATAGNDYETISLWHTDKTDTMKFCKELWHEMIKKAHGVRKSPEKVLGTSVYMQGRKDWMKSGTSYRDDSPLLQIYRSLASKDSSFRAFLKEKGIDLSKVEDVSTEKRSSVLRQAVQVVPLRDAFLKEDGSHRSRKSIEFYTGSDAIFTITEGNPRWFKGIVGQIIARSEKIDKSVQIDEVEKAIRRFRALMKTMPAAPVGDKQPPRGLLSLIDSIGRFFRSQLLEQPFSLDPPGTFTVDSRVDDDMLDALARGINSGAFVFVERVDNHSTTLRGKRLRLSYLWAPHFNLPLRLQHSISLSAILSNNKERTLSSDRQLRLDIQDNEAESNTA